MRPRRVLYPESCSTVAGRSATEFRGHMGLWDYAPTPLSTSAAWTPLHEHVLEGDPRQRGQRGLDRSTKAVPEGFAGALVILPASNMQSTVSRTVSTLLVRAQVSLSYSCTRARGQYVPCAIAWKWYCLSA